MIICLLLAAHRHQVYPRERLSLGHPALEVRTCQGRRDGDVGADGKASSLDKEGSLFRLSGLLKEGDGAVVGGTILSKQIQRCLPFIAEGGRIGTCLEEEMDDSGGWCFVYVATGVVEGCPTKRGLKIYSGLDPGILQ
jgi:hypothetical protein